jgi:hypothetical protein
LSSSRRSAAKRCSFAKLLPTAYPVFNRSLVRRSARVSSRGLTPGEHNFDFLDEDAPLDHLESSQIRSAARARPFACHCHTHTPRLQYEVVSRIVSRWRTRRGGGREGARGKSVCSVHDMFYHPGATRRNNPRLSRTIAYDFSCVTPNSQDSSATREDSYREDDCQKSPLTLAGRRSRTYYSPSTTCRRSPIVPRRSIGCRARDRSIADKPVYVRETRSADGGGLSPILIARAHTVCESRGNTGDRNASPSLRCVTCAGSGQGYYSPTRITDLRRVFSTRRTDNRRGTERIHTLR